MENWLPDESVAQKDRLLKEIYRVFHGVNRIDGVNWKEAEVLDLYGDEQDRVKARASDLDTSWEELVDNEYRDPEFGIGGWVFLDAIGFRYHLPAGLVRCLRIGYCESLEHSLTVEPSGDSREYRLTQISALNDSQQICVKHFGEYMIAVSMLNPEEYLQLVPIIDGRWQEAMDSYWTHIQG